MGNVFRGIEAQLLAELFGVDLETARRLQGHDDKRGHIVLVEGDLQMIVPPRISKQQEEQGSNWAATDLEENMCTATLVHRINNPSRPDFFNPRAGRLNSVNGVNLDILKYLEISADHGVLYTV